MRSFYSWSTLALGLSFGALVGSPVHAFASEWEADAAHSKLEFSVRHMMISDVRGEFKKFTANVHLDDKDVTKSTVEVTIDADSIYTDQDQRDGHLKSPDFLDAAKFPTITFKSTKVIKAGKDGLKIVGDLTIKGVTKSVELGVTGPTKPITTPKDMGPQTTRSGIVASAKVKRKDFGITWNKKLDGGGLVVGEDIAVTITAELVEKK